MSQSPATLTKVINESGYLFQIAVEHEVEEHFNRHHWKVLAREFRWMDRETGDEGFIDLILERQSDDQNRMVIECKRVKDADWIFLVPSKEKEHSHHSRLCYTCVDKDVNAEFG